MLQNCLYWALMALIASFYLESWQSIGQNKSQNHGILTTFNNTFPLRMTGNLRHLRHLRQHCLLVIKAKSVNFSMCQFFNYVSIFQLCVNFSTYHTLDKLRSSLNHDTPLDHPCNLGLRDDGHAFAWSSCPRMCCSGSATLLLPLPLLSAVAAFVWLLLVWWLKLLLVRFLAWQLKWLCRLQLLQWSSSFQWWQSLWVLWATELVPSDNIWSTLIIASLVLALNISISIVPALG